MFLVGEVEKFTLPLPAFWQPRKRLARDNERLKEVEDDEDGECLERQTILSLIGFQRLES